MICCIKHNFLSITKFHINTLIFVCIMFYSGITEFEHTYVYIYGMLNIMLYFNIIMTYFNHIFNIFNLLLVYMYIDKYNVYWCVGDKGIVEF